jgi:hypothetical protein
VFEHGGDTTGVSALLRIAPEHGLALVMLTNGGDPGPIVQELLDRLLRDLAGIEPSPKLHSPDPDRRVQNPGRYLGQYQTRTNTYEVTLDADDRLWLTVSDRNEALTMAETAGVTAEPRRYELRPFEGDTFVLIGEAEIPVGVREFVGSDDAGRARFLHTGRAAPRTY